MNRVGQFEKVSYNQFKSAFQDPSKSEEWIAETYDCVELPTRATSGSAGYDFVSPITVTIAPDAAVTIPTGICVKIDEGWWLSCLPRSGMGFKYQVHLANTMGVIDSDYFYSKNEGHIFIKIVNGGSAPVTINAGDSFAQAIFLPYGITYSDAATGIRDGGMGSTGK